MKKSEPSQSQALNRSYGAGTVDLTNCDREAIHIPGSIQPHGLLFALREDSMTIVQVSENTEALLGVLPQELLGQPLTAVANPEQVTDLQQRLQSSTPAELSPVPLTIQVRGQDQFFDGLLHRSDGLLILELEPLTADEVVQLPNFYYLMRTSAAVLQGASDLLVLSQAAAELVRKLTGFDRVMVYRFHEDWHGEVIAEAKREDLEPYLGLHYPASDIPQQARELYLHNWLRLISDVSYTPARIIPTENPVTSEPLNLSFSTLRSVSPVHIQYLKNMKVAASMSVSIIKNDRLWGLISCHHETAKRVPYTVRVACEFLGQILSLQIAAKEEIDDYAYETRVKDIQTRLLDQLLQQDNVQKALLLNSSLLLSLVNARGAALYFDDHYFPVGEAPDEEQGRLIVEHLKQHHIGDMFFTDSLPAFWDEGIHMKDQACGLLAISISPMQGSYILWFRPEAVQILQWGGEPTKPFAMNGSDKVLHPRSSFAVWSETVRLKATPWKQCEIDAVQVLRSAVVDRVLRYLLLTQAQEMATLNMKLEESNEELNSFAYTVSHDLKEPLRGIHNYVHILKEDYKNIIDAEGMGRLHTLLRLTRHLDNLIDALLHYSRVGRVELSFADTDLNEMLERTLDILKGTIEDQDVTIRIPRPLPVIWCDRVRVGEIFNNLITNAIKYNDKAEKIVEIGYLDEQAHQQAFPDDPLPVGHHAPPIFYVRDNGIGIRDKYFDSIFRIFKRLHGRDKFGGGTGAGLTIVKRIVERHGGKIWVKSEYGVGTTFYFTLREG